MLNPYETAEIRAPRYSRPLSVKEGLIQEEDEDPADAGQDGTDPKRPWPGGSRHDERGNEWSQVWTQNDRELNVIDDSGMLMEKEEILNPHQGTSLAHATEEAIDDACSKVGVETRSGCRPDACAYHNGLEEKGDRQASKVIGESNDKDSARSNREQITHNGMLHLGRRQVPLAVVTGNQWLAFSGRRAVTYNDCGMTVMMAVPPV